MIASTVAMNVLAGRDHLVAAADVERAKRQLDRRQPRADADGVAAADVRGVLGLEPLDRRAHDEVAAFETTSCNARSMASSQRRVLRAQIDERHRQRRHFFSPSPR